jgi:hypothetical protein
MTVHIFNRHFEYKELESHEPRNIDILSKAESSGHAGLGPGVRRDDRLGGGEGIFTHLSFKFSSPNSVIPENAGTQDNHSAFTELAPRRLQNTGHANLDLIVQYAAFPQSLPFLQLLLALDGGCHGVKILKPNQSGHCIFGKS